MKKREINGLQLSDVEKEAIAHREELRDQVLTDNRIPAELLAPDAPGSRSWLSQTLGEWIDGPFSDKP